MADQGDRRPLSTLTTGIHDYPPATGSSSETVTTRLERFRRTLERQREESLGQATTSRHERWAPHQSSGRRRSLVRPAGPHSPTFHEGRSWSPGDESPDDHDRPRHAKRRRLNSHGTAEIQPYHKYGYYGQVEPGQLKLDLFSCDGGVHDERSVIYYGPNNMLKHDQSVYSSKSSTCNVILQHQGESPFSLDKLVIIAPEHGFTAPVQGGSVSIGMSLDDLLAVQADLLLYDRDGSSPDLEAGPGGHSYTTIRGVADGETADVLNAREWVPRSPRSPFRLPELLPRANVNGARDGLIWSTDMAWPPLRPSPRALNTIGTPSSSEHIEEMTTSGVKVTIAHDEEVDWPEIPTSTAVLADRQRREQRARDEEADSDERSRAWDPRYRSNFSRLRRGVRSRAALPRNRAPKGYSEPDPPFRDVHQVKFKIKDGRHKVAIKFDPPVAGTYLLLQLQASETESNVDVQTVIASGYAGPRFIPAIQLR